MAFFERTDERDRMIKCNICDVMCSERSMTKHRMQCCVHPKQVDKFKRGKLIRCIYDSGHIVPNGQMDDHLEFCTKYQNNLVSEFQRESRMADTYSLGTEEQVREINLPVRESQVELGAGDDWGKEADEPFISNMAKLRLDRT